MKHLNGFFAALLAALTGLPAAAAELPTVESVLGAVVALHAEVPSGARTAEVLGLQRSGQGVVIDADGLVLTIGYLILEAETVTVTAGDGAPVKARILAYDHPTGFGLVRALGACLPGAEIAVDADLTEQRWIVEIEGDIDIFEGDGRVG